MTLYMEEMIFFILLYFLEEVVYCLLGLGPRCIVICGPYYEPAQHSISEKRAPLSQRNL